jgi:putative ABC transport system permease protein
MFKVIAADSKVSFTPLILSFLSLVLMTVVSVSWHIYKAHTSNPTKYLKDE